MRFEFHLAKNLRCKILSQFWRFTGVPTPSLACTDSAPQLCLERPFQQTFPVRYMMGLVDEVARDAEDTIEAGQLGPECRSWNGQSEVSYPQGGLFFVDHGSVVTRRGILISPTKGVLESFGGGLGSVLGGTVNPTHLPRPKHIRGSLLVMSSLVGQRNYYHWTFELLAQLRFLEQAGMCFDFVAVPRRHAFAKECLELFGVKAPQILLLDRYTHLRADRLIVPSFASTFPHPSGVRYLRDTMRQQPWSHFQHPNRLRLYVTRGRFTLRRIINDAQVYKALKEFGFQRVSLEKLSVRKQIQLFQQAEAVVGPHGAGFSNLAYCRPDTLVCEITATSRPPLFFHYLAVLNQLRYGVFFAKPVTHPDASADILVDVEKFNYQVSRFLKTHFSIHNEDTPPPQ